MTINPKMEQHFRKAELPFLEAMDDVANQAATEYRPVLTNFLNPRQAYLLGIIVNGYDGILTTGFGGVHNAEMKRFLVYPDYFEPTPADYHECLFEIQYPVKFATLQHHQILGTLMGTGIERDVIGDIVTDGQRWQFYTTSELADYLKLQIDHIGRTKVTVEQQPLKAAVQPVSEWKTLQASVSSLRIDNVIAQGYHVSRQVAKELVSHGKIHLNWAQFERPDYELAINDVLSVRGYGRIKVIRVSGVGRHGKLRVDLAVLKK